MNQVKMTLDCEIQRLLFTRIKIDFPEFQWTDYCTEVAEIYRMLIARTLITGDVDWDKQRESVQAIMNRTKENVVDV